MDVFTLVLTQTPKVRVKISSTIITRNTSYYFKRLKVVKKEKEKEIKKGEQYEKYPLTRLSRLLFV